MEKYSSKYFGVLIGILAEFIYLLAVIKSLSSEFDSTEYIKPLIPFFNEITFVNVIGGVAVTFLWGWVLGYFFMLIYNWIDKKISSS